MKQSGRVTALILAVVLVFSLLPNIAFADKARMNILIYMIGSDMESEDGYATKDVEEIIRGAKNAPENVNILIYAGGTKQWKNIWFRDDENSIVRVDKTGVKFLCSDGKKNMVLEDTLVGFLEYVKQNYPAEDNMLIFWDHGGGSVSGFGFDERFAVTKSLTNVDIGNALKTSGMHFGIIGFDACLMGAIETALTMAPYADFVIASEEAEHVWGWKYDDWLKSLFSGITLNWTELGKTIIDTYIESSKKLMPNAISTLSMIDTGKVTGRLLDDLKVFSSHCIDKTVNGNFSTISQKIALAKKISHVSAADSLDLVYLAQLMDCEEGNTLAESTKEAIVYNRTVNDTSYFYGMSILFPYKEIKMAPDILKKIESNTSSRILDSYKKWVECFATFMYVGQQNNTRGRTLSDVLFELLAHIRNKGIGRKTTPEQVSFVEELLKTAEEYVLNNKLNMDQILFSANENGDVLLHIPDEQRDLVTNLIERVFLKEKDGQIELGQISIPCSAWIIEQLNELNDGWVFLNGTICPVYFTGYELDSESNFHFYGLIPIRRNDDLEVLFSEIKRNSLSNNVEAEIIFSQTIYDERGSWICDRISPISEFNNGDRLEIVVPQFDKNMDIIDFVSLSTIDYGQSGLTLTWEIFEDNPDLDILTTYCMEDIFGNQYPFEIE